MSTGAAGMLSFDSIRVTAPGCSCDRSREEKTTMHAATFNEVVDVGNGRTSVNAIADLDSQKRNDGRRGDE